MPEKRFKTVLEIGGNVGSSLKNSFNVLTGNTKQLGVTIKSLNTRAKGLRGELKKKKLGGPEAASGIKKLESELSRLETRIKRTRMVADGLARIKMADLGGRMSQIGGSIKRGATIITAATAGATASIYAMVNSSAGYADMAKKTADAFGMQTNALIKMKHAADLSGVSGEQLEIGFKKLLITMEKGRKEGTKENHFLNTLGLNPEKLARLKDNEKKIKAYMEAFSKYEGSYKTQIASLMMGDPKMVNFLNLSKKELEEAAKEAEKLGLTVTDKQITDSVLFKDLQTKIGATLKGVGNIISTHLLPHFNEFSDQIITFIKGKHGDFQKWAENFGIFLKQSVPVWVEEGKKFGQMIGDVARKIWKVIESLGGVKVVFGALVALPLLPVVGGIAMLSTAILGCIPAVIGLTAAIGPVGWGILGLGAIMGGIIWKWDLISKKIKEFAGPVIDCIRPAISDLRIQFSNLIEEMRPIWETVAPYLQKFGEFFKSIWNEYLIFYVKALTVEFKILMKFGEAIREMFGRHVKFGVEAFTSSLKILTSTLKVVKNVGSQAMSIWKVAPKTSPTFSPIVGSSLGFGDIAISGARALGGPVSAGKRYLIGERGPEIFQPRSSGQIIPNGRAGGNTDNRTFNITIHAAPGMNERAIADLVMTRLNRQQHALAGGVLFDSTYG